MRRRVCVSSRRAGFANNMRMRKVVMGTFAAVSKYCTPRSLDFRYATKEAEERAGEGTGGQGSRTYVFS